MAIMRWDPFSITRWDPFGELASMRREMDRLFSRLGIGEREATAPWLPQVDVKTSDREMVVYAELPGLKREEINVEVSEGLLTISGERRSESEKSGEGWLMRERSYGSFARSLALPEGAEPEKITADYQDGVLEIHVPTAVEALKPAARRIPIGSGSAS